MDDREERREGSQALPTSAGFAEMEADARHVASELARLERGEIAAETFDRNVTGLQIFRYGAYCGFGSKEQRAIMPQIRRRIALRDAREREASPF